MTHPFPELEAVRISVGAEARQRHLAAIDDALRAPTPRRRRFRLLAVAVATLLLLPVIALAADRAAPGDLLYPIRQILQGPLDPVHDSGETGTGPTDDVSRAAPSSIAPNQQAPGTSDRGDYEARDRGTDRRPDDGADRTTEEDLEPSPPVEDRSDGGRDGTGVTVAPSEDEGDQGDGDQPARPRGGG